MARARVFVLRDRQKAIFPACEELVKLHISEDDNEYDQVAVSKLLSEVNRVFQIELQHEEFDPVFSCALSLSGLVARKVLDKDPPETTSPWNSPWNTESSGLS